MRLLNVDTLGFEEYIGKEVPPYAILSHTWGDEEVSYAEFCDLQEYWDAPSDLPDMAWRKMKTDRITAKAGYRKIVDFSRNVKQLTLWNIRHVWVDTCCINKSSSAELQEAINSMFRWYKEAQICFAYLSDVPPGDAPGDESSAFRVSRWFTRGWTLQELIAPKEVVFFDQQWGDMGSKLQNAETIESITGIRRPCFLQLWEIQHATVAQKMSWAAQRETTREEDMAYCLLGIFDIHMPMLYGEGKRAFLRLQEEIMKVSDDSSVLAWGYSGNTMPLFTWSESTILASSPTLFKHCQHIASAPLVNHATLSFSVTQRGLRVQLPVASDPNNQDLRYGIIACHDTQHHPKPRVNDVMDPRYGYLAIPLLCNSASLGLQADLECSRLGTFAPQQVSQSFLVSARIQTVCIQRKVTHVLSAPFPKIKFELAFGRRHGYNLTGLYPPQPNIVRSIFIDLGGTDISNTRTKIFRLTRGSDSYLLIYDYKVIGKSHFKRADIDLDRPCQVYQAQGEFTLEFAQKLASDMRLREQLTKATLTDVHGRELLNSELLDNHSVPRRSVIIYE